MTDRILAITKMESQHHSEESESHHDNTPTWQPFWLRRSVLVGFFCWFLCCTVALIVLLFMSKREGGICQASQSFGYVYRFAPTAAAFLSRVELQILRYYPWVLIQHSDTHGPEAYHLNYTSMILPMVLFRSLQQKHILVALVTTSLIILRVQIVLSPALFILGLIKISQPAQVQILNSFTTSEDLSNTAGPGFIFHQRAISQLGLDLPFGIAEKGTFQTFELLHHENRTRGTLDKPLKITTDGLFMDMECTPLDGYNLKWHEIKWESETTFDYEYNLTINFEFKSCNSQIDDIAYLHFTRDSGRAINWTTTPDGLIPNNWTDMFADPEPVWWTKTFEEPQCPFLPQQNMQFAYFGCFFESVMNKTILRPMSTCAAMICSSTAWVSKVEVLDRGFDTSMTVPSNQGSVVKSDLWKMIDIAVSRNSTGQSTLQRDVGPLVKLNENFRGQYFPDIFDKSNINNTVLEQAIKNVTQSFGPWAAHYHLRKEDRSETNGSVTTQAEILQVNQGICIAMVVLSSTSMLAIVYIIFSSEKISKVWYRNPTTILGFMTVMNSDKDALAEENRSTGQSYCSEWGQSNSSLAVLGSKLRLIYTLYVTGLICGLSISLGASQKDDGLATIDDDQYISFLWRITPALAMFLVTIYASTVDSEIRDFAILSKLSTQDCSALQLDISMLDMLGFRALYHSALAGVYTVTISQSLAALCTLLITISSLLFNVQYTRGSISKEVRPESWFGTPADNNTDRNISNDALGSLVLTHNLSNFTYPRSTYADLLLPTIPDDSFNLTKSYADSAIFEVPAAKLLPICEPIPRHMLNITVEEVPTDQEWLDSGEPSFYITFTQQFQCPPPKFDQVLDIPLDDILYIGPEAKKNRFGYFGMLINTRENADSMLCGPRVGPDWSLRTYLWGNLSVESASFDHLSVWKCNYTWLEVPTTVEMVEVNGRLEINRVTPPVQDIASLRPWSPPFPVPSVGTIYAVEQRDNIFPTFKTDTVSECIDFSPHFDSILEPFGPIKQEYLGDQSQEGRILDALHYSLGVVSVQIANKQNRLALNESSARQPAQHPDLLPIKAKFINSTRRRLVQNPTITYVLISILALVVIINTYALISSFLAFQYGKRYQWSLDMELEGLAPNGFGSIALIHTLLRHSNAIPHLPENAHLMPPRILYQYLSSIRFRMGWFMQEDGLREFFTIGVLDDDKFQLSKDKKTSD
ncbi:unnamed protein product [Clonostachys rosea]|uniref:Uncharacterized protein n=1 Tax=Bionectria ochroleuca TaxID=29856 RepID=A0ABY6UZ58_BIOOC|nr:unnamed protein product [Clonostachys rosea]